MGVDTLVPAQGVHAGSHRAMLGNAVAHSLEVVGPLDPVQGGEVHQDLPVDPEDIEQADIGFDKRVDLGVIEVVGLEHFSPVGQVGLLKTAVAVQFVEELLDVVQAHRTSSVGRMRELRISDPSSTVYFMLIALISTLGSGLLGTIAVLMHYLLKQNAQRAEEHKVAMAAIARQGKRAAEMHQEAMNAIAQLGERAAEMHQEAMAAIARQGERAAEMHQEAMAAIARLGERAAEMHQEAMNAIAKATADLTAHTEALHREAATATAQQGERIAALEAAAGLRAAASA